jgi:hypothetical protein
MSSPKRTVLHVFGVPKRNTMTTIPDNINQMVYQTYLEHKSNNTSANQCIVDILVIALSQARVDEILSAARISLSEDQSKQLIKGLLETYK